MDSDFFDLFKTSFSIKYNNRESFSTRIGACTSIVLIIFMLAYTCYLFSNLFRRDDPSITILNETFYDFWNITLNNSNHHFGIKINHPGEIYNSSELSKMIKLSAKITSYDPDKTGYLEMTLFNEVFPTPIN
jgi:hypothetical protein